MENGLDGRRELREYLVEVYISGRAGKEFEQLASRAAKAAEELEQQGKSIRYVRSIFVPEEETCFHVYSASSAAEVREASERAGIDPERVAAAIQAEATRHAAARRAPTKKEEK